MNLPVADPRFSREGVSNLKGGQQPIIWPKFAENGMKMKKLGLRGMSSKYDCVDPPLLTWDACGIE